MKIANKGYTITAVSWENDGDNYNTKNITVDSESEAIRIAKMCKDLFSVDRGNGKGTVIGNMQDWPEARKRVFQYLGLAWDDSTDKMNNAFNDVMEIDHELLGVCEYLVSRVCESATITYSPEDIHVAEIEF